MDWQKNRLWIAIVLLLGTSGAAFWLVKNRTGDSPAASSSSGSFPEITRSAVTSVEVRRPEDAAPVTLTLVDGHWRVTSPVDAPADGDRLETVLDKLVEMDVESVASRNAEFHGELEVDAEHGVHVIAKHEGEVLADFWIGTSRSGNTAVRLEGHDETFMVDGSIRFAFAHDLKDWRDRTIVDTTPESIRELAFRGPNGTFRFTRADAAPAAPAEGEGEAPAPTVGPWTAAEVSYVPAPADGDAGVEAAPAAPSTTLEHFAATRVASVASTLARLNANDFATADITPDAAGIGESSPVATITTGEGDARQTITVRLGNEADAERHDYYAMREGNPTIFVISRYHAERIHPLATLFEETAGAAPAEGEPPAMDLGAMMGGAGGGGGQIPPELMQQIQQQLQQQAAAQGGHP